MYMYEACCIYDLVNRESLIPVILYYDIDLLRTSFTLAMLVEVEQNIWAYNGSDSVVVTQPIQVTRLEFSSI